MTLFGRFKGGLLVFAAARLQEASTWRGVTLLLTSAGATFSPEQAQAIVTSGIALAGALAAFLPDR